MSQNIDELVQAYRAFDAKAATKLDRVNSKREHEQDLFVPSEAALHAEEKEFRQLLGEVDALPAPDPVFLLLKTHFYDFLKTRLASFGRLCTSPSFFVSNITWAIGSLTRQDSRPSGERAKILLAKLAKTGDLWAGVRTMLDAAPLGQVARLVEACGGLELVAGIIRGEVYRAFEGMPRASISELERALDDTAVRAGTWKAEASAYLESRKAGSWANGSSVSHLSVEEYRKILDEELGIDLDELLSWHEDEVDKTRAELFESARKIKGVPEPRTIQDIVDLLNTYAGPANSPDEMFERMRVYLKRAQATARQYVNLPEENCRVVPTPEQIRDHYPWGGYGGGCPRRRPLLGEVFLNDHNYKAITDGWIKMNAVHECYPGHHVQWVKTVISPLPETVKEGAKRVPNLEGSAHRSERLTEHTFPEDPFYPLFVSYRRHHTSVRIKADLTLYCKRRPIEEVVDLYVQELGFDRNTARGQVKSQEITPGYFNCYYYGMKKMAEYQERFGYNDEDFSEIIFTLPHVSLSTLEKFLGLTREDQKRFLNDFPSLVEHV